MSDELTEPDLLALMEYGGMGCGSAVFAVLLTTASVLMFGIKLGMGFWISTLLATLTCVATTVIIPCMAMIFLSKTLPNSEVDVENEDSR